MLIKEIKHRFKMIFKPKYDNDIYCNYLKFYNLLYEKKIKSIKQMKKILIKMVEKSYNKTINENESSISIYIKERHEVDLYWNKYFMSHVLKLKYIYDESRDLCKKYKQENYKYKQYDAAIERFNKSTETYLIMEYKDYLMYMIRILDIKIDIYYNVKNKRFYTKKYKIKGEKSNDKIC